ncbi:MAG: winged helix-turn-helix transcriptional regulator [Acidobacteria bacterium]|nr:winged helix-turn-helix transcriptional regulator [Acidobacteriota bacterium]
MKHGLNDTMIGEVTGLFGALGDQSRLRILRALLDAKKPLSQGAVAEKAELSQANASKHLACLVRVGLVTREQEGNTVYFSPILPLVSQLCDLVCGHVTDRVKASYKALK